MWPFKRKSKEPKPRRVVEADSYYNGAVARSRRAGQSVPDNGMDMMNPLNPISPLSPFSVWGGSSSHDHGGHSSSCDSGSHSGGGYDGGSSGGDCGGGGDGGGGGGE